MSRMLALKLEAQKVVSFLARNEQQIFVRPAAAFVEHRLHLGQPQRPRVLRMAVAVKLGQMDQIYAHRLEYTEVIWWLPALESLRPLVHRVHSNRHVVVA